MSTYTVTRSLRIEAPIAQVHALVDDLREWQQWSPWEGLDPDLERTYTGPVHGVGAKYAWSGNRDAGTGTMQVTRSEPHRIDIDLTFTKPFPGTNDIRFDLADLGDGATRVTWTLTGRKNLVVRVFGRFLKIEQKVGEDFEKGLAQLKAVAER